jgi:hypothetical protein
MTSARRDRALRERPRDGRALRERPRDRPLRLDVAKRRVLATRDAPGCSATAGCDLTAAGDVKSRRAVRPGRSAPASPRGTAPPVRARFQRAVRRTRHHATTDALGERRIQRGPEPCGIRAARPVAPRTVARPSALRVDVVIRRELATPRRTELPGNGRLRLDGGSRRQVATRGAPGRSAACKPPWNAVPTAEPASPCAAVRRARRYAPRARKVRGLPKAPDRRRQPRGKPHESIAS